MTTPDETGGISLPVDPEERIQRLERRLERERKIRQEAEDIAERGMRDLWVANRGLEARVEARTAELRNSLNAATAASDTKERFLSELGHDLTTPLHALLGQLELIDPNGLDDNDRERLESSRHHASELAALLRRLIELANAGAPSPPGAIVERMPAEWLDSITDSWTRPAALTGHLLLSSNEANDVPTHLDWHRLSQLTDIAVANATAHTTAGPIRLTVSSDPATIRVSVEDPGPGMTDEEIAIAFDAFAPDRPLGVGLATASQLAEAGLGGIEMRCDHDATSAPTTLMFWLPIHATD